MMAACGNDIMVITIMNKTAITSPNYPEKYLDNLDCTWKLVSDDKRRIRLMIEGDEIENGYV